MLAGTKKDRRRLERRGRGERIADALRWRLGQRPAWQVSIARGDWRAVDLSAGVRIPNPAGGYLADPFLFAHEGCVVLFAEEFRWAERKGRIAAYALEGGSARALGPVVDEDTHLSFPFTFRGDGALWMAPECSAGGGLRLYRCLAFPDRWTLEHHCLPGERLADPLLLKRDGRWWLLANRADPNGAFTGRLCAWHADALAGPWIEHAGNPVVLDRASGRNGGLLWEEGTPFRVGQRQGADVYGRGLGIYRIEDLTPDSYHETPVARLGPKGLRGVRAVHHMSAAGGWTAWDVSRWAWPR